MQCRWLGWAGVEIEEQGETIVVDPLADAAAVFAAAGEAAANVQLPEVAAAAPGAVAGLVTHRHRDHADAGALKAALAAGAPVYVPGTDPGGPIADAGSASLDGLSVNEVVAWDVLRAGPFAVTAIPAADGTGDPQVSWAVAGEQERVIVCGDTMFHGWWWRAAMVAGPFDIAFLPINGAVLDFPWRRPASGLPAVMGPEQAVVAGQALGARLVIPMHYGAYDFEPFYRPVPDALARFVAAAEAAGLPYEVPAVSSSSSVLLRSAPQR